MNLYILVLNIFEAEIVDTVKPCNKLKLLYGYIKY